MEKQNMQSLRFKKKNEGGKKRVKSYTVCYICLLEEYVHFQMFF